MLIIILVLLGMTTNATTENNTKSDLFCVSNYKFCDMKPLTASDDDKELEHIEDNCEDSGACAEWIYVDNKSLMEKPLGSMDRTVFANINEINRLSIEAQKFIDNHFDINTILRIRETMQPEDFDEEGPTEENWDLFVQTNDDKVHYFSYHHFWSHGMRHGYSMNKY